MRCTQLPALLLAVGVACSSDPEVTDPLARDVITKLATAQGSASGSARSGAFTIAFTIDACDCPSVEIETESVDLCELASFAKLPVEVIEGSGILGVSNEAEALLLTGAIDADGSFIIAGTQDVSTLASPLEVLRRVDGQFNAANDRADGWAGQRLLGELASEPVDCRWTGSFVATRD